VWVHENRNVCEVWRDSTKTGGMEEEDGYAQVTESPDRSTLVVRYFPQHSTGQQSGFSSIAVAGGWLTRTIAVAVVGTGWEGIQRLGQPSLPSKGLLAFAQGIGSTTVRKGG